MALRNKNGNDKSNDRNAPPWEIETGKKTKKYNKNCSEEKFHFRLLVNSFIG